MEKTSLIKYGWLGLLMISVCLRAEDLFNEAPAPQSAVEKKVNAAPLYLSVYRIWPKNQIHALAKDREPLSCLRRTMGAEEMILLRWLSEEDVDFISTPGSGVFFCDFYSIDTPMTMKGGLGQYLGVLNTASELQKVNMLINKIYPAELINVYDAGTGYLFMLNRPGYTLSPATDIFNNLNVKGNVPKTSGRDP